MITGTEIALGGVVVAGLGVVLSPLTAYLGAKLAQLNEHRAWLRQQQYAAYTAVLRYHARHADARMTALLDRKLDCPEVGDVVTAARLVASPEARKALRAATVAEETFEHRARRLVGGPMSVNRELTELLNTATDAEATFEKVVSRELTGERSVNHPRWHQWNRSPATKTHGEAESAE